MCAITFEFDYQLDAYYTAADFYIGLSTRPIPHYDNKSEWEIYKKLFLSSPVPRFLLLEASFNPLPWSGTQVRKRSPGFYEDAQINEDLNWVQSVTTGFEEPWAASVFLGNIVNFEPQRTARYGEGKGHMGYLVSFGNYHILDNRLIRDSWLEAEWKVKGDRIKPNVKLKWSFRLGSKRHSHPDVRDVFYVGIRRSRTDYKVRHFSLFHNSGISYKFDFSQTGLSAVQHHLELNKKFPMEKRKIVPSVTAGLLLRSDRKYTGALAGDKRREFRLIFQPNLEF